MVDRQTDRQTDERGMVAAAAAAVYMCCGLRVLWMDGWMDLSACPPVCLSRFIPLSLCLSAHECA